MVKVRNRSLFIWLLVAACLAPPALASSRPGFWLAQANIDNPDAVDNPDGGGLPTPTETPPPELSPSFSPSDTLPEDTNLTIEGSASMAVITDALVEQFQQQYPNTSVTLVERPTEVALQNLQAGTTDLAAIGRSLNDEQQAQGLTEVPISREKIAVIVGENNPFQGQIEAEDFVRIFRGDITNWSELGGPDIPLRFIDRPATSDTRAALADYEIFGGDLSTGENVVQVPDDSTAEVVAALGDNGIGYAIASQVIGQDNVRVLSMHDTLPDDPRYPYSQPRSYVYRNADSLPVEVEAFLALATDAPGQAAVAEAKAAEAADVAAAELPDRVSAVRPNGQGFVTGDRAGNLNFWNTDGTSAGDPVSAHTGPVTALAFSPDGQRLISGGADGTIRLWDAVGTPIGDPINAGNGPVTSLTVQPDGGFISASADGTLQRWDNLGNPLAAPITGHEDTVRDIVLSPDGATLVTASTDGTIRRWNAADGAPQGEPLTGHQGGVQALAMKPDGSFFSGGADATVRRWGMNGNPIGEPLQVPGPVNAIAANSEGTSIAVGDDTGSLQYLSGEGVPVGEPMTNVGAPVDDLAFTPDGQRLIVSAGEAPQLRDSTGEIIPTPTANADGEIDAADGLPPEVLDLWNRIRQLPPRVLWIIPVVVLGLLLLGLLRSFRKDEAALEDDEGVRLLPGDEPTPENGFASTEFADDAFTDEEVANGTVAGFTPAAASEALDGSLTKAKQKLAEGVELGNSGRYQAALDCFNKAIELADIERLKAIAAGTTLAGAGLVIARGLARRGTALANLQRPEAALKSLNRSLEMEPNDAAAWIGKGHVLMQMSQLDEALFCFDKAIELNPNLAAAWQGKGQALQKMGRDAEARNCFNKAAALGGASEDIPLDLGTPAVPPLATRPSPGPGETADAGVVMRPAQSIEPGPAPISDPDAPMTASGTPTVPPGAGTMPPNMDPPLPSGPIGPIGIVPPAPLSGNAIADLPPELQAAIASMPDDPNAPLSEVKPTTPETRPDRVEPTEPIETPETAVPSEILQTVEKLPTEVETPDPNAPLAAPDPIPPEVAAILSGDSDIPPDEEPAGAAAVKDPMATYLGNDATVAMRPRAQPQTGEQSSRSPQSAPPPVPPAVPTAPVARAEAAVTPDQPTASDQDALAGLPPEVLEALKGIPEDSPDSFDLPPTSPSKPPPPPPPSNPRLRDGPV